MILTGALLRVEGNAINYTGTVDVNLVLGALGRERPATRRETAPALPGAAPALMFWNKIRG